MKIYDQKSVKSQAKLVSKVNMKEWQIYTYTVYMYI